MVEPYVYKVKYRSNYDGDTIRVDIYLGFNIVMQNQVLRLYGINTPEMRGPDKVKGKKVRDYVKKRMKETPLLYIRTHKDKKGKYGRWLAEVFLGNENLNETLLEKRYAVPFMV